MKAPLSWIQEFINVDVPHAQIAKLLTMAGLEVEGVESVLGNFSGVVVARVISCDPHPDADKLQIATVLDGESRYQVVCGAPNCRPGIKTAFAKIGAKLQDRDGKSFKIRKAKMRGVESQGMLCAADELGFSDSHEGIIEFGDHVLEGSDVSSMYSDTIFDIALTPNLGHCFSLLGIARELSAILGIPYRRPSLELFQQHSSAEQFVQVRVEDNTSVLRYACSVIQNVKVGSSPDWLVKRLHLIGKRSVNNVVDATNYVLHEMGQPLHAFDLDCLEGKSIVVRRAKEGEQILTLDDNLQVLSEADLVICDIQKPVALAGVIGGANSEVSSCTKNILIESALFDSKMIRQTSKRLDLKTDASKKFEKGGDPNSVLEALERVSLLIQQIAGGEIASGFIDIKKQDFIEKKIECRLSRIHHILGFRLGLDEVESIIRQLNFSYQFDGKDVFSIQIPTYRLDIHEEIDIIEEVARIYGYDKIPKQRKKYHNSSLEDSPIFTFEGKVRERLISEGLQEFISSDLIGPSVAGLVKDSLMPSDVTIEVLNPSSIEQSLLRTSLLPGLLQILKDNYVHQNCDISGFEVGRIHFKEGETYKEQTMAGVILTGKVYPNYWGKKIEEVGFFYLKGIIENLFSGLSVKNVTFQSQNLMAFHPGRQASIFIDSIDVGTIGELHPNLMRALDISQRIYFAEINLHDLYQKSLKNLKMEEIPKYPGSNRDWTITLEKEVLIQEVLDAILSVSSNVLENVVVLDLYQSPALGENRQNVTFRFFYRDRKKTLSQEFVDEEHGRIVQKTAKLLRLS